MNPFHQAACQTQNFESHFVSNIIFDTGGVMGRGMRGCDGEKREGVDEVVVVGVSEDCYSKDKRSHQSKLKQARGLE